MNPDVKFLAGACLALLAVTAQGADRGADQGAAHPDMTGIWAAEHPADELKSTDGKAPPLLPEAQARYDANRAAHAQGNRSYDPASQCVSPSIPWLLQNALPVQVITRPKSAFMLFQWNRLMRIIDLDVAHTEPPGPTYFGQSVGHWDGKVLVVDTNSIESNSMLDAAGLPHSDQLHLVERWQLAPGGQRLTIDMTLEDPATFSRSWQARFVLKRLKGVDIQEDVCVERLNLPKYR